MEAFIGVLIGVLINILIIKPIKENKARKECIEKGWAKIM